MKWVVIALILIIGVAVGAYWYEWHSAESALLAQPVYRVLKKHEPGLYEDLLDEYRVYERDETRSENFINLANSEISVAATKRLAHASQQSVLDLINDMLGTAKKLQAKPGDACFRYWFPQVAGPPDIAQFIEPAAQAHTLDLMSEVIRSSAEDPAALPDAEAVKANLTNVINATYDEYGTDAQMISHAEDPRVDRAKVCTITISVYDRIMKLPPAQASELVRAMTQLR